MLWLNVPPCCRYRSGKPTRTHLPHDRLLQRPLQDCQVRPSPPPHWVNTTWLAGPQVPHRHRSGREPQECEREHRLARLCRVWKLRDHETSHWVRGQVISWIYWWPNFFCKRTQKLVTYNWPTSTHFFRSHRSSILDFHFLSHYSYIKGNHCTMCLSPLKCRGHIGLDCLRKKVVNNKTKASKAEVNKILSHHYWEVVKKKAVELLTWS